MVVGRSARRPWRRYEATVTQKDDGVTVRVEIFEHSAEMLHPY